jgi:hypothetical protein
MIRPAANGTESTAGPWARGSRVQVWYKDLGPAEEAVTSTWALGACATATDAAEPTRIDPAALSASIAGMMVDFPMRMIPPCRLQRSAAWCMAPATRTAHLSHLELLPVFGCFIHSVRHYLQLFQILKIAFSFCCLLLRKCHFKIQVKIKELVP